MPHKDPIVKQRYHNQYTRNRMQRIGDEREAAGLPRVEEWKISSVKRYRAKHRDRINAKKTTKRCEKLAYLIKMKADTGCKHCPESHPACLDFHHRDPTTKLSNISRMTSHSWEKLLGEIAKCDIICKNCHHKLHWGQYAHASKIAIRSG